MQGGRYCRRGERAARSAGGGSKRRDVALAVSLLSPADSKHPHPLSAFLSTRCGFYTAWGPGLRPLSSKWSKKDEYAPVPAYVDEAERLFRTALACPHRHMRTRPSLLLHLIAWGASRASTEGGSRP
eukprot:2081378-Rhodomonas_salina.2